MLDDIADLVPFKIIDLTAGEYRRENFMLFGGGQDKYGRWWWFFQCFQESIEGCDGQHMDLIDDEKLVVSLSGRDAHLFVEIADVIHRIMRSRIQFDYIGSILFLKCHAGSTFPTCL